VRGIWFAGLDHIRIGDGRKRRIAGIFDRRRRRIGNRRQVARRNARLGRGRLGNLLRMVGVELFQNPMSFRYAPLTALSSRSRVMHPQTLSRLVGSAEPALPGHLQFLVLRLEVGQVCL
jgi:hypothetical protein